MDLTIGPDIIFGAAVEAIVAVVEGAFPVYTEQVLQRFKMPCVFVFQNSRTRRQDLGDASWLTYKLEATYHAGKDELERYQALRDWGRKLEQALRVLSVDDRPVRASDLESKAFDDYLVVYASYKLHCREESTSTPEAGTMSINIETK